MTPTEDQYRGAMVGLALGDALGAPHEGGPVERLVWRVLGSTRSGLRRYTDDTQMSIDLALSLINNGAIDQDDLAARFASSYRWDRGYGPSAARTLKQIRAGHAWKEANRAVHANGSFGNGGAMRSPVVGLFFHSRKDELRAAARMAAEVTHAHPLGMEGAELIAAATAAALECANGAAILQSASQVCSSEDFVGRLTKARGWLQRGHSATPREVRRELGMGVAAPSSCVTALYLAVRFLPESMEALLAFAAEAGGDVDTVGAMAGAIWGAHHGFTKLPVHLVEHVEGNAHIADIAGQLYTRKREG